MPREPSPRWPNLEFGRFAILVGLALVAFGVAGWYVIRSACSASSFDAAVLRIAIPSARPITGPDSALPTSPVTANLGNELRAAWPARPGNAQDLTVELFAAPEGAERAPLQEIELRFAFGVHTPLPATQGEAPLASGGNSSDAVRFVVEQVVKGRAAVLFSRLLAPGTVDGEFDRWHEGSVIVPLAASGQAPKASSVEIRLRSEGSPLSEASRQPYWGDVHLAGARSARPRSILLISIDTLRADRLSILGRRERETTPRIDAWARRHATVFSDAVAAAPWTLPSHVTILSGLEALHHGINRESNENGVRFAGEGRAFPYLAELFRAGGFRTGASVGGGLLSPQFGFAAGFDVYRWWYGAQSDLEEIEQGARSALAWLRAYQGEPSLFFLHTYRVHSPFERDTPELAALAAKPGASRDLRPLDIGFFPPLAKEGYRNDRGHLIVADLAKSTVLPFSDLRALNDAYDAGVLSADAVIGDLLQAIEREHLDEGLTIVITSDHGEALGEGGRFGHHDLHDPTLSVPLLLAVPGGQPRLVSTQVRHVDLLPTILEAAGIPAPATLDGVSLLPFASGSEVDVPRLAWSYSGTWNQGLALRAGGRFKLLLDDTAWEVPGRSRVVGFDLVSDPAESSGLALPPPPPSPAAHATLAPDFAALRTIAEESLAGATGLWLHLSNPSQSPLELRLASAGIVPDSLKLVPTAGLVVHWVEMGHAAVTLAPGRTARLLLTCPLHHPIRLALGRESSADESFTLTLEELAKEPVFVRDKLGWMPIDRALEPGDTGVAFEWIGPTRRHVETPPAARDSATEEQLRALGYVN